MDQKTEGAATMGSESTETGASAEYVDAKASGSGTGGTQDEGGIQDEGGTVVASAPTRRADDGAGARKEASPEQRARKAAFTFRKQCPEATDEEVDAFERTMLQKMSADRTAGTQAAPAAPAAPHDPTLEKLESVVRKLHRDVETMKGDRKEMSDRAFADTVASAYGDLVSSPEGIPESKMAAITAALKGKGVKPGSDPMTVSLRLQELSEDGESAWLFAEKTAAKNPGMRTPSGFSSKAAEEFMLQELKALIP